MRLICNVLALGSLSAALGLLGCQSGSDDSGANNAGAPAGGNDDASASGHGGSKTGAGGSQTDSAGSTSSGGSTSRGGSTSSGGSETDGGGSSGDAGADAVVAGGGSNNSGGGENSSAGAPATATCAWDSANPDHCPVCDASSGCTLPGYKYPDGETITSSCCGLVWQQPASPTLYTWSAAKDYCAALSLMGDGWRVPTIAELFSIVDSSTELGVDPTIDLEAFPDTPKAVFWSASTDGPSAWSVNFADGTSNLKGADTSQHVRCVR